MSDTPKAPTGRDLLALAWPMSLRAMMLHGIVVIDAFLVAFLGEGALAAMGLASAVVGLVLGVLMAFSMAAQILVAQAFGSGRDLALKTVFVSGLIISLIMGGLGVLAMALFSAPVLASFAHTPEIASEAGRYLSVFTLVVLAEAVALSLSAYYNGCGETRLPFYSYLVSLPINVGASYALIHGIGALPELGLTGAAVGTAIGAAVRMIYLIVNARGAMSRFIQTPGWDEATLPSAVKRHLLFALPVAATFVSATFSNSVCMLIYANLDIYQFAAMTLILPWVHVAGTFGMAWAQGAGILVAQLLGRGQTGPVLDGFLRMAWRGAFVAAGLVALVYLVVVHSSGWLYAELDSPTRAALLTFLPVLLVLPFPKVSNAICGNTLRAAGETVYVMYIFVWSQWLFKVPATAALVLWLQVPVGWVFALLLAEEFVKAPAFHHRMLRGDWRIRAQVGAG